MLAVARQRAAERARQGAIQAGRCARARLSRSRASTSVVCLRVLMHTPDWRRCVAELCRVAERLVIVDYPSARSVAALEVAGAAADARRRACGPSRTASSPQRADRRRVRPQRLPRPLGAPSVRPADRAAQGDRIAPVHAVVRRRARPRRPAEPFGSPVTLVAERCASSSPARPGSPGGHLARALVARGDTTCRRSFATAPASRPPTLARAGVALVLGDLRDRGALDRRRPAASTSSTTSPRSTGRRAAGGHLPRGQCRRPCGDVVEAAARGRRPARRALQHGRRARRRRASAGERGRAAQARRHLSGDQARRRAPGARGGRAARASR